MRQPKLIEGPFNHLRPCRHGHMLYNINDVYIGRSLDLYGEFSEGEIEFFRQVVKPGNMVLDVGANIGAHTLALSHLVGPAGKVYAFEPQRIVYQTLCANMAINSVTNVNCYNAALGPEAGSIVVPLLDYAQANNFGGLGLGGYQFGEVVEQFPLDSLQLGGCHLIKVDVEGMELQVLRGAVRTIEQFRPVLYVENDRAPNSQELMRFIDSLGYEMYWHLPPLYNPENYYENPENVFDGIVSINLLCVIPNPATVISGFQRARPGEAGPLGF